MAKLLIKLVNKQINYYLIFRYSNESFAYSYLVSILKWLFFPALTYWPPAPLMVDATFAKSFDPKYCRGLIMMLFSCLLKVKMSCNSTGNRFLTCSRVILVLTVLGSTVNAAPHFGHLNSLMHSHSPDADFSRRSKYLLARRSQRLTRISAKSFILSV